MESHAGDRVAPVEHWLAELEEALTQRQGRGVAQLFIDDAHWRDVVALTWKLGQVHGSEKIESEFSASVAHTAVSNFRLAARLPGPRRATVFGREVIEAFFDFDLAIGHGTGVVRLIPAERDDSLAQAFLLLTLLQGINAAGSAPRDAHATRYGYDRAVAHETWLDHRQRRRDHVDSDPEVLIVGASQSGLMLGARLEQLGIDTLIIDKTPRVGDAWRSRYNSLALHTPTVAGSFPYMPFPETYPKYLSKDKLADWIELYAAAMDLNVMTSMEMTSGTYDSDLMRWTVIVDSPTGERTLRPRQVALAVGAFGQTPNRPSLPGLDDFLGPVMHSVDFRTGADFAGKRVLIVGVGTSAHDVALDMRHHGADVTMVQRGSLTIINLSTLEETFDAAFPPGVNLEEVDLLTAANQIFPLVREAMVESARTSADKDADLIERLNAVGFATDLGEDGTGWQMKPWRTGAGYYINVGASEAIARGEIRLVQASDIGRFVAGGVLKADGSVERYDVIMLATGFLNASVDVARLLGDEVAERLGSVYRMDDHGTGEWQNAWGPTAQEGLWFIVGGLPQSRPYSLTVALQIKAALDGLVPMNVRERLHVPPENVL